MVHMAFLWAKDNEWEADERRQKPGESKNFKVLSGGGVHDGKGESYSLIRRLRYSTFMGGPTCA